MNNKDKINRIRNAVNHPLFYIEEDRWYLLLDNIGIAIGNDIEDVINHAYNMVIKYGGKTR